jgi:hypothetical protein
MSKLRTVFIGTDFFTLNIPSCVLSFVSPQARERREATEIPGFEAVYTFNRLGGLHIMPPSSSIWEPFTHAQAVCVTEFKDCNFPGEDFASVLVLPEAARWVLCFPVCKVKTRYAPQTKAVALGGEDVFYTFSSLVLGDSPEMAVQAVPDLDSLHFLSPHRGDKLAVIRAKRWDWDDREDTVFVWRWDITEVEFISGSEVRIFF